MPKQTDLARLLFVVATLPALIVLAIIPMEAIMEALEVWAIFAIGLFAFHIYWESTPCQEP